MFTNKVYIEDNNKKIQVGKVMKNDFGNYCDFSTVVFHDDYSVILTKFETLESFYHRAIFTIYDNQGNIDEFVFNDDIKPDEDGNIKLHKVWF